MPELFNHLFQKQNQPTLHYHRKKEPIPSSLSPFWSSILLYLLLPPLQKFRRNGEGLENPIISLA